MSEIKLVVNFTLPGRVIDNAPLSVEQMEKTVIKIYNEKTNERDTLIVRTRPCKPAIQQVKINVEQYKNMSSEAVPYGFRKEGLWLAMTKTQRIEYHIKNMAHDIGATKYEIQWL